MDARDRDAALAHAVAVALVGAPIEAFDRVGGGRNSRVYHVRTANGDFALKQYPVRREDPRDRLGTEVEALRLMSGHGLANVPQVIAIDEERGFALLSWLEGSPIDTVSEADVDQAASFLGQVHAIRNTPGLEWARPASEACLSGREIAAQIEGRIGRLRGVAGKEPGLRDFLEAISTDLSHVIQRARDHLRAAEIEFDADLPHRWRTLVPADFGFHNGLRRADGELVFFDFEYFGWDDPVKLTADVMLHPGTPVAAPLVRRFRNAALSIYGSDPVFSARLLAFYPLFGLRWALILLNEFLPERWSRRVEAGATESWDEAKERQLARARALLAQMENYGDGSELGHQD